MSYFTGKNLEQRIKDFDLGEFDLALRDFMETEYWPGVLQVPASADILESTRNVLYSMLHRYGLKDLFTVKLVLSREMLTVERKVDKALVRVDNRATRSGGVRWQHDLPTPQEAGVSIETFDETDELMKIVGGEDV
jgi:hypothetical protein